MNDQNRPKPEWVHLSDLTPKQRLRLTAEILTDKYSDEYLPPMRGTNRITLRHQIHDEIWREIHSPKKTLWEEFRDSDPVMKSAFLYVLANILGGFIWLIVAITLAVNGL